MMFNNIFKGKKVLVTGDTGFKGSWMAMWLLELGADVYGYSLEPKPYHKNYTLCGLGNKYRSVFGDVRNREALINYFAEVKPDIAFHLAAQPIVLDSYQDPHSNFETNLMGVVNFFDSVRQTPSVQVAINVTSDKCYQNNEWIWGYRETDAMGGKDPYSASKGASEIITQSYLHSFFSKEGTANIASGRAGNVIGGGDWAPFRIVPDYFRALADNKPLIIRNPNATRPWQHVLEPVGGYLTLAAALFENGKKFSGGWNFGPAGGGNQPVIKLVEALANADQKGQYKIEHDPNQPHEAHFLHLDISKATHYLNWNPTLNFEQTIDFTSKGYLDEFDGGDLFDKRMAQIRAFTNKMA